MPPFFAYVLRPAGRQNMLRAAGLRAAGLLAGGLRAAGLARSTVPLKYYSYPVSAVMRWKGRVLFPVGENGFLLIICIEI